MVNTLSYENLVDIEKHFTSFGYLTLNRQVFANILCLADFVMHHLENQMIKCQIKRQITKNISFSKRKEKEKILIVRMIGN